MSVEQDAPELQRWLEELRQLTEESGQLLHHRIKELLATPPATEAAQLGQPLGLEPQRAALRQAPPAVTNQSHIPTVVMPVQELGQAAGQAASGVSQGGTSLILGTSYSLFGLAFALALLLECAHLIFGLPLGLVLAAILVTDIAIGMWFAEVAAQQRVHPKYTDWRRLLVGPTLLLQYGAALCQVATKQGRVMTVPTAAIVITFTATAMWLLWSLVALGYFGRLIISGLEQRVHLFAVTHLALSAIWGCLLCLFGARVRSLQ